MAEVNRLKVIQDVVDCRAARSGTFERDRAQAGDACLKHCLIYRPVARKSLGVKQTIKQHENQNEIGGQYI
ncbi:hypothetical protein [Candidatus Pantoea bituminis]|uniref:hypothetical protein n=1 Tax=Candidatus Pantoea bituminis TaxID=2831036 RepID=UPI001C061454|nr:hypothetical protein [Pantoea bituminis]